MRVITQVDDITSKIILCDGPQNSPDCNQIYWTYVHLHINSYKKGKGSFYVQVS